MAVATAERRCCRRRHCLSDQHIFFTCIIHGRGEGQRRKQDKSRPHAFYADCRWRWLLRKERRLKSNIEYIADNKQNHFLTQDLRNHLAKCFGFKLDDAQKKKKTLRIDRNRVDGKYSGIHRRRLLFFFSRPIHGMSGEIHKIFGAFTRTDRDGLTEKRYGFGSTTTLAQIQ